MDKVLRIYLLHLILATVHGISSLRLVTFGELSEVILDGYNLTAVGAIEEDLLNPGGFIVGDQHSVVVIAPNRTVQILAGHRNQANFSNGVGDQAYFFRVSHLTQYRDGADIVVADYGNHCIRIVNRATARVSTFAGRCTHQRIRNDSAGATAHDIALSYPVNVMHIKEKKVFYYLLYKGTPAIMKHNVDTDYVSLVYRDEKTFRFPTSAVISTDNTYLYVNHAGGISKFNVITWERTVVAGTNSWWASLVDRIDDNGYWRNNGNGRAHEAIFLHRVGMVWLIPDQVLITNQYRGHSLRVVNFVDDVITTICKGWDAIKFTTGNLTSCKMNLPLGITAVNNSVYIGESSGIYLGNGNENFNGYGNGNGNGNGNRGNGNGNGNANGNEKEKENESEKVNVNANGNGYGPRAHLVKLTYNQPTCTAPTLPNFNGTFSPDQELYTNEQTITYKCNNGYGIDSNYSKIYCVRDLRNGVAFGKWNRDPPGCQIANLASIHPSAGQRAGGTRVTLRGIFPSNVKLSIINSDDNHIITTIAKTRFSYSDVQLEFAMPPFQRNFNTKVKILASFGAGDTEIGNRSYTYLPNPEVTSISRNESIAQGELQILFFGHNLSSSSTYSLLIFRDIPSVSLATVPCSSSGSDPVECYSPNLSGIFNGRAPTQGTTVVKMNLLADGSVVRGAETVELTIVNSAPRFYWTEGAPPLRFDVSEDREIKLNGSRLNISVIRSDYIARVLMDDGSQIACTIIEVKETELFCEPSLGPISNLGKSDVKAIVTVQVGQSDARKAGNIVFTSSENVSPNSENESSTSKDNIDINLVFSLGPASVVVVILIVLCVMRKNMRKRINRLKRVQGSGMSGDQPILSLDLQQMLNGMYLNPSDLTFDARSNPIGKGNFGKVYLGQLKVKGNVLKTVAVKVMKGTETEDITESQLEDFLLEATFLKYIKHVNILSTLGVVWRTGDRPHVVLPYMVLGDLCSLVQKPDWEFTIGDLMHFGMQVARGMEYLTDKRCLHRDLAARNCLVNDKYLVKIADFGMSKDVYVNNYYRESEQGKPKPVRWMALESLREGVYTTHTEVWSFGVLMWELFTRGNLPYPGVESSEILLHLTQGYRLNRPTYAHQIIFEKVSTCWLENPLQRPTFSQLGEYLESLLLNPTHRLDDEQSEGDEKEWFVYSYVQNLTSSIPSDYSRSGDYADEDMIIYIDQPTIYGYELQPLTPESQTAAYYTNDALELT